MAHLSGTAFQGCIRGHKDGRLSRRPDSSRPRVTPPSRPGGGGGPRATTLGPPQSRSNAPPTDQGVGEAGTEQPQHPKSSVRGPPEHRGTTPGEASPSTARRTLDRAHAHADRLLPQQVLPHHLRNAAMPQEALLQPRRPGRMTEASEADLPTAGSGAGEPARKKSCRRAFGFRPRDAYKNVEGRFVGKRTSLVDHRSLTTRRSTHRRTGGRCVSRSPRPLTPNRTDLTVRSRR